MNPSNMPHFRTTQNYPFALALQLALVVTLLNAGPATADTASPWSEIDLRSVTDPRLDGAPAARAFFVDPRSLEAHLRPAAKVGAVVTLALPRPEGGTLEVQLRNVETLAPAPAAPAPTAPAPTAQERTAQERTRRPPEVLTLAGHGGGPQGDVRVRITWSPSGFFRAWVREAENSFFIEPIDLEAGSFVSYRSQGGGDFECTADDPSMGAEIPVPGAIARASTEDLDIFRLAVAATYEYNLNVGNGNAFLTYLWIISTINDVNGILEPEARVRLQLIPETADLIYVEANDPYNDYNRDALIAENQANLTAELGLSAFDLGHVFSWYAAGGKATISSVCSDTSKGRGVSGWEPDPLQRIEIVAHEMGHQLGAQHTFNSSLGWCSGARSGTTAWEAGSGTSLMSYGGGGCYPEDAGPRLLQLHSKSREEIRQRVSLATSATGCGNPGPVANTEPWVLPLGARALPAETPFRLQALASDGDGDALIFCWEQRDLGASSPPHHDNGSRPLFALECGTADAVSGSLQYASRTFPAHDSLLRGAVDDVGQTLPTTNRDLRIGVSVRDGRGGYSAAEATVEITAQAGPFRVTYPNDNTHWNSTWQNIRWDVAGTTAAPVSCPKVDILLSTDGGFTFPITLLSETSNDGYAWVSLPPLWTTQGRIEVGCSNHAFFDVSDRNIWIQTLSF